MPNIKTNQLTNQLNVAALNNAQSSAYASHTHNVSSTGWTVTASSTFVEIGSIIYKDNEIELAEIFGEEYTVDEINNINKTNSQLIRIDNGEVKIGKEVVGTVDNPEELGRAIIAKFAKVQLNG